MARGRVAPAPRWCKSAERTSALSRRVAELDGPVRAVAERLVPRGTATAQRVALSRRNCIRALARQRNRAGDRIGPVLRYRDPGRALRRRCFDVIDRIA